MKAPRLLWLFLAVLLVVPAGTAFAQVPPLDHFLVYQHAPIPAGFTVRLTGQFDTGPVVTNVADQVRFANPVEKTHSGVTYGIADPWRHYNWYRLLGSTSEPVRNVRFRNQFGEAWVKIQTPVFLLVPAEKLSHQGGSQPPVGADHYKCYQIVSIGTHPPTPIVGLKDQFQSRPNVGVFSPRLFCVPVEKDHAGQIFPIQNPVEHLVVYDLSPWIFARDVVTRDQFLTSQFTVDRAAWLAVPTYKLAWTVASAQPVDP